MVEETSNTVDENIAAPRRTWGDILAWFFGACIASTFTYAALSTIVDTGEMDGFSVGAPLLWIFLIWKATPSTLTRIAISVKKPVMRLHVLCCDKIGQEAVSRIFLAMCFAAFAWLEFSHAASKTENEGTLFFWGGVGFSCMAIFSLLPPKVTDWIGEGIKALVLLVFLILVGVIVYKGLAGMDAAVAIIIGALIIAYAIKSK